MSDDELRTIVERVRGDFEIFEDRLQVPRRLLSDHEIALLQANPDEVKRLLCASGSEQEEEQETTVAGTLTLRPATVAPSPESERPETFRLPREKWEAAGIFVLNGIPSHSRGDQHAERIISGEITFEQAAAQQLATRDMLTAIQHNAPPFSLDQARAVRDFLRED